MASPDVPPSPPFGWEARREVFLAETEPPERKIGPCADIRAESGYPMGFARRTVWLPRQLTLVSVAGWLIND